MKSYKVTMCDKGEEWFQNSLTVEVKENEHPRNKAVSLLCKMGYMRYEKNIRILDIKRVN